MKTSSLALPAAALAVGSPIRIAEQIIMQINGTFNRTQEILKNGVPERKNLKGEVISPAIPASSIAEALGEEIVNKIQSAINELAVKESE